MAPLPPPALSAPADGQDPPPLDPRLVDRLLTDHPDRAAALISALRLEHRVAQGVAHGALYGLDPEVVGWDWRALMSRYVPALPYGPVGRAETGALASVYDPVALADLLSLSPAVARTLIAALSPAQRTAQAEAQADWLVDDHGLPAEAEEILAGWERDLAARAA
ncbi:MAG: hypothetical protein HGA45_19925 [Chloroflexales bacterium]|nr:hypothetical protein [Chloroflexales bacterium]